jgi:hypothetical protein
MSQISQQTAELAQNRRRIAVAMEEQSDGAKSKQAIARDGHVREAIAHEIVERRDCRKMK